MRLLGVVALALSPLLVLSGAQAYVEYHDEMADRQARLILQARISSEAADSVIAGARPLLEALRAQGPVVQGEDGCTQTFRLVLQGVPRYSNIVRVDDQNRLLCSALPYESGGVVGGGDWSQQLRDGADYTLSEVFTGSLSRRPVMLAAVPVHDATGRYNGAVALAIDIGALPALGAEGLDEQDGLIALADRTGRIFVNADRMDFDVVPASTMEVAVADGGAYWDAPRERFGSRDFVVSPLAGDAVFMVIASDQLDPINWAILDVGGTVLLPVVMWLLALTAVAIAADRMVLRWVVYLRRIASLYAGGRLRVEPRRAQAAPAEIRELASTLDDMANRIAAREAELVDAVEQKTALLKEIHHRVKNNLQIIISLLNIQISKTPDSATVATLDEARARINALALVHKSLYEAEDLRLIPVKPFFSELMSQLAHVVGANGEDVSIDVDIEPLSLTTEAAVPLALFATESATNAFKHAFEGREAGRLRVSLRRLPSTAEIQLDIEDDGGGWSPDGPAHRGVGSSLMSAFARQLGGRMETGASTLGGARVTLVFPVKDDVAAA